MGGLICDVLAPRAPTHWCLALHGLGDDRHGWKPAADELGLPGLGWLFAQAPDAYGPGFSWFPIPGMTGPDDGPDEMAAGIRRSRGLLTTLIDERCTALGIGRDRLFLFGFSQGCLMVLDQALRADETFAGTVAISGFVGLADEYPQAFGAAARRQPIFWSHGSDDGMLPLEGTAAQAAALRAQGVQADWRVYAKDHTLDPHRELGDLRAWLSARMRS